MKTLQDQLREKIATGTEAEVRAFVIERFNEFPKEVQQDLAVELFRESMANDLTEREKIVELKKELVDAIDASEKDVQN